MRLTQIVEQIHEQFECACRDLFASLNCSLEPISESSHDFEHAPIACIDAGSSDIELNIGLELPMEVLALTYPVPNIIDVDEESLEDWISELSNQLIGRLKAKLLKHNLQVDLGLPTSYFGADLDNLILADQHRLSLFFDLDGESCAFHIGIEIFAEDIDFSLEEIKREDDLAESEIELF